MATSVLDLWASEVYIVFLPSIALVAMIIPTFARTPIVGYTWIVLSAVGTGFSALDCGFTICSPLGCPAYPVAFSQQPHWPWPYNWRTTVLLLATLLVGRVQSSVPTLFIFGGIATFILGGLTGVMVAVAPFDFQAHDTYLSSAICIMSWWVAQSFLFCGSALLYPCVMGKQLSKSIGKISFWLTLPAST